MNIALVGPMASGKSTLGSIIAEELKLHFFDTDHIVEFETKQTIVEIFEQKGEEHFRHLEMLVLKKLLNQGPSVIATGGGIVLSAFNRKILMQNSFVIYLAISINEQLQRTSGDTSRPLLIAPDKKQRLIELQQKREPLYQDIANVTILVDKKSTTKLAEEILSSIYSYHNPIYSSPSKWENDLVQ